MIMLSYACRNQRDETFTFRRQGKEKTLAPTVSQDDWTFVGTDEVEVCYTRQEYNDEANLCLERFCCPSEAKIQAMIMTNMDTKLSSLVTTKNLFVQSSTT